MAALYKRYIPPKASEPATISAATTSSAATVSQPNVASTQPEKKRKRERSEAEIAERKAKKLRKKGIDPATQIQPSPAAITAKNLNETAAGHSHDVVQVGDAQQPTVSQSTDGPTPKMSIKKRHKLEKEARKARKAAEKAGEEQEGVATETQDTVTDTAGRTLGTNGDDAGHAEEVEAQVKKAKKERKNSISGQLEDAAEGALQAQPVMEDFGDDSTMAAAREADAHAEKPKKKRKKKVHDSVQRELAVTDAAAAEVGDDETSERDQVEDQSAVADNDAEMQDQLDAALSQPKKRRHKLEAALKSSSEADQDGEDGEHLRKHSNVLGKYEKAKKYAEKQPTEPATNSEEVEQPVLHDLVPLPQPEKAPTPEYKPDSSALPAWLAKPTVVSSDSKASFSDLGLDPETLKQLSALGFHEALPVQQALMPLLIPPGTPGARYLPGTEPVLPDVAVSAATGSGKTIAYLVPTLEALKKVHGVGRLKALIVVPTRELVSQVATVAESLAKGTGITIGIATGSGKLKDEQDKLVRRSRKYDPEGYAALMAKAHQRNYPPDEGSEEFDEYLEELEQEDVREEQKIKDAVRCLIDHVPVYESAVDILICTPGRLLEHVSSTLGFTLSYLNWLVLDEADKLLDQQYDGFIETLDTEFTRERLIDEQDARERYLRSKRCWDEQRERRVRKVVLSATMTRDISKLAGLRLQRPRMIVVRGQHDAEPDSIAGATAAGAVDGIKAVGDGFELPPTLVEFCVPVGDGSEKPLYLIELLEDKIMPIEVSAAKVQPPSSKTVDRNEHRDAEEESSASDSDSDMDLVSSSELSSSSAENTNESDEDESETPPQPTGDDDAPRDEAAESLAMHPARAALISSRSNNTTPTILIFTSESESATRLSRLLCGLKPNWSPWITTVTKARPNRKQPANASQPSITISTDLSARGLDQLFHRNITHVIQYDVPRSLENYVHRVGRTARAGGEGEAWTLYTNKGRDTEAGWFLNKIAKTEKVRRPREVGKMKIGPWGGEQGREEFAKALKNMGEEVFGKPER